MTNRHLMISGAALAAVAGLAGCNQPNQPPKAGAPLADVSSSSFTPAPLAEALPPAPPARVSQQASRTRYAYLDRAYEINDVFDDAPPDYAFDYDGVEPWAWRTDDGYYRVGERVNDGWRYYYYEPGDSRPFLVRDPGYAYGFERGVLVVVYDSGGRVLSPNDIDRRADIAGRYLARADRLRSAADSDRRQPIATSRWAEQRSVIEADRARLASQQQTFPEWRDYRQVREPQDRAHWRQERARRVVAVSDTRASDLDGRGAREQVRADRDRPGDVAAIAPPAARQTPPPVIVDRPARTRPAQPDRSAEQQARRQAEAQVRQAQQAQRAQQHAAQLQARKARPLPPQAQDAHRGREPQKAARAAERQAAPAAARVATPPQAKQPPPPKPRGEGKGRDKPDKDNERKHD